MLRRRSQSSFSPASQSKAMSSKLSRLGQRASESALSVPRESGAGRAPWAGWARRDQFALMVKAQAKVIFK